MDDEKEETIAARDLFGDMDNVETKGNPKKGRIYMWFSIIMFVILSMCVLLQTKHMNMKQLA